MALDPDFLYQGSPPKSVTTYGETVKNIPKWLSDYTQGMIAKANAVAAEPYIGFGGPRIAGFAPEQEAGFAAGEEAAGAYQPYLEGATASTIGGLEEASRSFIDEGNVEQYMNPYIENVLNRQESLAGRTLEEKFLPALQQTFGGAGQYGSRGGVGSMETAGIRGVRDIQENLEEQRLATLGGAYGQAADIFGQDVTRAGQFGLAGGQQLGALGEAAQGLGLRGAGALEAIGAQRRGLEQGSLDLAYGDFREQRDLPFQRLGFMSNIIRGMPMSEQYQTTERGPASVYQPSPFSQMVGGAALYKGLTDDDGIFGGARGGYLRGYAKGGLVTAAEVINLNADDYWEVA
jgi:hypothetical protein